MRAESEGIDKNSHTDKYSSNPKMIVFSLVYIVKFLQNKTVNGSMTQIC
jgi:hypothetical protein